MWAVAAVFSVGYLVLSYGTAVARSQLDLGALANLIDLDLKDLKSCMQVRVRRSHTPSTRCMSIP